MVHELPSVDVDAVAVDPDEGLAEHARRAGWPIVHVHPLRHPELLPQATRAAPANVPGMMAAPQA